MEPHNPESSSMRTSTSEPAWGASAAQHFRNSRHEIPELVLERSVPSNTVKRDDLIVDLGCGTGLFTRLLQGRSQHVVGIDTSAAMLKQAQLYLEQFDLPTKARLLQGDVATIADLGQKPQVITLCRSFFAMPRMATLEAFDRLLAKDGYIALIEDPNFFRRAEPWQQTVQSVVARFLGRSMEAVPVSEPNSTILSRSSFNNFERSDLWFERLWSLPQILSTVYSTISSPLQLLADRRSEFEAALSLALAPFFDGDHIAERAHFEIIRAWR